VHRGKVKPFLTMKEDATFVEVFESLGKSIVLMPSVMADLEWYVCAVYGTLMLTKCDITCLRPGTSRMPLTNV